MLRRFLKNIYKRVEKQPRPARRPVLRLEKLEDRSLPSGNPLLNAGFEAPALTGGAVAYVYNPSD